MVKHARYNYIVSVRRDQVPGWNHQPEDFKLSLERHLKNTVDHYKPVVVFLEEVEEVDDTPGPEGLPWKAEHEDHIQDDDRDLIEEEHDIGTCQGCGGYGRLGKMCVRNGEECGEFL